MNATETRIANTFAPAILDEIEAEVIRDYPKGSKAQNRALVAIAARRVQLSLGVEETHEGGSPQLLAQKRKIKWVPIKRIEGTKVYHDGWERPKSSRKAGEQRLFHTPRLLLDTAEIDKKIKLGKPAGSRKKVKRTKPATKTVTRKKPQTATQKFGGTPRKPPGPALPVT